MKKIKIHLPSLAGAILYTVMTGQSALADDTEVLIGPGGVAWSVPNVLFIMDTSGSMAGNVAGGTATATDPSRLSIVQGVFSNLMNDNSGFNVGLMRFNSGGTGGYIVSPMQKLNSSTRAGIIAASDAFTAGGNTPLSETLYEATRYYSGMSADYGSNSVNGVFVDSDNSNNYLSPITSQCQKNFVILLTDGQPTSDTEADSNIQTLTGNSCNGNCLDEVAEYLHTADQSSSITGTQTVETYTIGFTTNQTLLENAATKGGGDYMTASNATELSNAFSSVLASIVTSNNSFSAPTIAANAFNSISHFNRLYLTLFEPAASPKWIGNVKPYALNDNFELVDADNLVAVDSNGLFLDTSRSFWSATDDGGSIEEGGANGRLPAAADRNLYTYTGTDNHDTGVPALPASSTLSNDSNALANNVSSNLTAGMLGMTNIDAAALETAFNNVIDTTRASTLADPLHSKPTLVTYGGTADDPDITLFVATNGGFLHAINASTYGGRANGEEQFAFVPKELLTNLPTLASGTGSHPYGLDGDVTAWVQESDDEDFNIEASDGDHVYVYSGMRRGGSNYYALDVTNRTAPTLKWVIKGGDGGTTGFSELGQSWSRPAVTTIKYGTGTKTVLIFGGGYDTAQDANPVNTDDTIGRAIFIVDADTGAKLWQADSTVISAMTNSIPSDIQLMDSDFDGHTDRLYVGDMRGQIFRIDLEATTTGISGSGIRLANFGGTDAIDNRRFYYPPDVVITQQPGVDPYVSINIGSGYRAHPLNPTGDNAVRVNDRFYSLRDPNVFSAAPDDFTAITDGDGGNLFDATSTATLNSDDVTNLANSGGWFITLGNGSGEKVLAPSITLNGEIFFTTYTPPASVSQSECAPPPGVGSLYRVSLFNATPTQTSTIVDVSGNLPTPTTANRVTTLGQPGIPSEPAIMFRERINEDGTSDGVDVVHCEGTECEQLPDTIKMEETYWRD